MSSSCPIILISVLVLASPPLSPSTLTQWVTLTTSGVSAAHPPPRVQPRRELVKKQLKRRQTSGVGCWLGSHGQSTGGEADPLWAPQKERHSTHKRKGCSGLVLRCTIPNVAASLLSVMRTPRFAGIKTCGQSTPKDRAGKV